MDITAKFCQKEMEEYGACVASNPSSWQEQCHHLKVKVAQCTSSQYVYTGHLSLNIRILFPFFFFCLACSIFSIHGTRLWFRTLSDLSFPLNFKSALIVPLHHFNRNVQCIKGYFRGVWVCACVCRLARAVRRGYRHIVSTSIWVTYLIIRDLSIHPLIISYWTDSSMETL